MNFLNNLNEELSKMSLLEHPFYKAWNEGTLSRETLGVYATEYYHHVAAFPRYISQIHTLSNDIQSRQVLLDNLIDEEKGDENHPELWLRFTEGISGSREVGEEAELASTRNLVDGYFDITKKDYSTGLGMLYAYERQTPEVSKSKIEGLQKHYDIVEEETLKFFKVHQEADEWHTEELASLIRKLEAHEQEKVHEGAIQGAKLLWHFLDGIMEHTKVRVNM